MFAQTLWTVLSQQQHPRFKASQTAFTVARIRWFQQTKNILVFFGLKNCGFCWFFVWVFFKLTGCCENLGRAAFFPWRFPSYVQSGGPEMLLPPTRWHLHGLACGTWGAATTSRGAEGSLLSVSHSPTPVCWHCGCLHRLSREHLGKVFLAIMCEVTKPENLLHTSYTLSGEKKDCIDRPLTRHRWGRSTARQEVEGPAFPEPEQTRTLSNLDHRCSYSQVDAAWHPSQFLKLIKILVILWQNCRLCAIWKNEHACYVAVSCTSKLFVLIWRGLFDAFLWMPATLFLIYLGNKISTVKRKSNFLEAYHQQQLVKVCIVRYCQSLKFLVAQMICTT